MIGTSNELIYDAVRRGPSGGVFCGSSCGGSVSQKNPAAASFCCKNKSIKNKSIMDVVRDPDGEKKWLG